MATIAAQAAVYSQTFSGGFANGGVIPDGNAAGWSDSQNVSMGSGLLISSVTVGLNVSGGYDGDLYAYLSYTPTAGGGSGFAVLLNRVGMTSGNPFGSSASGFTITLSDLNPTDIHMASAPAGAPISGAFAPDGRNVNPQLSYDTTPRTATMSSFNNLDANGTWTLFFSDMSSGGQSTLTSWSLAITAIPEPVTTALGLFAGLGLCARAGRVLLRRRAAAHEARPAPR
jgi:hypothetical protein